MIYNCLNSRAIIDINTEFTGAVGTIEGNPIAVYWSAAFDGRKSAGTTFGIDVEVLATLLKVPLRSL